MKLSMLVHAIYNALLRSFSGNCIMFGNWDYQCELYVLYIFYVLILCLSFPKVRIVIASPSYDSQIL